MPRCAASGINGGQPSMLGCRNCGSAIIVGVSDLRQGQPKPTCRNRTRTTAKCRRKCCRKERPKPLVDGGHQSRLWIASEVGAFNQLRNWRNIRSGGTPRKTAGQSSQPDDDTSGTQPEADRPKGSGGAPQRQGAESPRELDRNQPKQTKTATLGPVSAGRRDGNPGLAAR